jgi:antibiotic biosynthesis monooxygenase (ABM) superfamily enzyme
MTTARQHYIDAAAMTKAELRKFNKAYGWGEWLSNITRPKMMKHFREKLATWITANGGEVPEV